MKNQITYEELHRQLMYNPWTGIFYWKVSNSNRVQVGYIAGTKTKCGYIQIRIDSKFYLAHRLAWFYVYGYIPENDIDHRDRVKYHNWLKNLREASAQCNLRNTANFAHNTSGIKGVSREKRTNKWASHIMINRKKKSLGNYKSFDNAVCARLAGEQCVSWEGCDTCSPAYQYVKENVLKLNIF